MRAPSVRQKIYEHFAMALQTGTIAPGAQLPTEAEIAKDFDVSRSTVQNVMSRLMQEGLVRRQAGRGTFACRRDDDMQIRVGLDIHNIQSFEDEVALAGETVSFRLLSFAPSPLPVRAARKLDLEPGLEVFCLRRLRFVAGKCIGSETRWFHPDLAMSMTAQALATEGVHALIKDRLGLEIGRIDAALRAVVATSQEARELGIEEGAPLLMRAHVLLTPDDGKILYGEALYVEPFAFRYSAGFQA
ncbi:GntR family transcriptional regulator [Salipiger mangrovisoli]|uniref:GntR family transcriptional regulator n=1 Tax=Salipiger mangrovisoli TaxID=2865933 RepID=A0ABR9X7P5_9RHOB|nr:GntR family transcriptional regulator [Salipiger mangrovisoli]MBE9639625.1 GntR family transcriptional regulator [Salipiger mangrovisoli]